MEKKNIYITMCSTFAKVKLFTTCDTGHTHILSSAVTEFRSFHQCRSLPMGTELYPVINDWKSHGNFYSCRRPKLKAYLVWSQTLEKLWKFLVNNLVPLLLLSLGYDRVRLYQYAAALDICLKTSLEANKRSVTLWQAITYMWQ